MIRYALAALLLASPLVNAGVTERQAAACEALSLHDFSEEVGAKVSFDIVRVVDRSGDQHKHCRVNGSIAPEVGFEVWLPTTKWNKRLLVTGCGGLCGTLMTAGMEDALARRYATATTDMGHSVRKYKDDSWAYNNEALEKDYAHRATHVTTLLAKALINAYYGDPQRHAFFRGCSTGGRQALVAANRYPEDFDGIIAGAPFNQAWSVPNFFWAVEANGGPDAEPVLTSADFELLHRAALAACDLDDGLADKVISDPEVCAFKPADIQCGDGRTRNCLSAAQVSAAEKIYAGARNSRGEKIYPSGPAPGSEFNWATGLIGKKGRPSFHHAVTQNWSQYLAYEPDPPLGSGPFSFDFDEDIKRMAPVIKQAGFNSALAGFADSGGKLLMYHGWVDESFPGSHSTGFMQQLIDRYGEARVGEFSRLYMIPGMAHCGGGPGAGDIDFLTVLERWVTADIAPDQLMAYKRETSAPVFVRQPRFPLPPAEVILTRPVFPWPDVAHYSGSGDPNDAANFERVAR